MFFENLNRFGERLAAVSAEGEAITYQELDAYANRMRSVIKPRSLVFCLCRNVIGSMAGYLSFLNNGVVPLMLDAGINEELLEHLAAVYQPRYIYYPEDLKLPYPGEPLMHEFQYCLMEVAHEQHFALHEDLAVLLTTSGSTGSPKLVRQSYQNIQANTESIVSYLELDETERPVTTLPMNYTYGLSIIQTHIMVGATILLTEASVVQKNFWDFMKAQHATSFGGVPYTYEMLKRIRFFRMDLPDLRTMTQAGGKLSPELHKEFAEYAQEKGKHFIVMYGQTEATARMAWLPYDKALEKYGSMGIVIPGGSFTLVDVDGTAITEPNVVGELVYEGPNVTLGYAECGEDLCKGDERDGRLETGDMAKRDADGYYYVVGRKKRFLKLYGNRVNLDEIDRMVEAGFPEIDCVSSGTDEQLIIYITDESCSESILEMVADKTHINQKAFAVRVIDKIPRNEAGKVLYRELPE